MFIFFILLFSSHRPLSHSQAHSHHLTWNSPSLKLELSDWRRPSRPSLSNRLSACSKCLLADQCYFTRPTLASVLLHQTHAGIRAASCRHQCCFIKPMPPIEVPSDFLFCLVWVEEKKIRDWSFLFFFVFLPAVYWWWWWCWCWWWLWLWLWLMVEVVVAGFVYVFF